MRIGNVRGKNLRESVEGYTFEDFADKSWDEYVKDILKKIKDRVDNSKAEDVEYDFNGIIYDMIEDYLDVMDGSFDSHQEVAILFYFEKNLNNLEDLNKALNVEHYTFEDFAEGHSWDDYVRTVLGNILHIATGILKDDSECPLSVILQSAADALLDVIDGSFNDHQQAAIMFYFLKKLKTFKDFTKVVNSFRIQEGYLGKFKTRSSMREGNPITNNLPANLDSFLMDMAQMVGPFDYSDIMHFANKISDVKRDKNVSIIRKLYAAAKDAKEYDDDEELSLIGEDLNDILTGVKDFNKPGMIFADTRTFKYEDSQNSEYNDLGTDTRTGEKFPDKDESLYESKKRVKESIQASTGNTIVMQLAIEHYFEDFNLDVEIEDYTFGNGWNTSWTFECTGEDFNYIDDEMLKSYILERQDFRDVELDVFSYRNKIEVKVVDSEDDEDDEDDTEPSKFSENTIKFNPSEVKVIHDRMEVENEWGKSVYEPRDLRLFRSIMDKCAKNIDGNINFTPEELKKIEDRLDIECHEWGGKAYDEHDLDNMEMVLGKIRRSRI